LACLTIAAVSLPVGSCVAQHFLSVSHGKLKHFPRAIASDNPLLKQDLKNNWRAI